MTCPVCGEVTTEEKVETSSGSETPNAICRYCRYMEVVDLDIGERDAGEEDERS